MAITVGGEFEMEVVEKLEVVVKLGGQFTVEVVMADHGGYNTHIYILY